MRRCTVISTWHPGRDRWSTILRSAIRVPIRDSRHEVAMVGILVHGDNQFLSSVVHRQTKRERSHLFGTGPSSRSDRRCRLCSINGISANPTWITSERLVIRAQSACDNGATSSRGLLTGNNFRIARHSPASPEEKEDAFQRREIPEC